MSIFGRIKNLFFSCAAQITQAPEDRPVFRLIRERKVRRIVEIGVGDCERTLRMLQAAGKGLPAGTMVYTGIDLFEARSDRATGVSLKEAHRKLSASRAKVRLVPGDPHSALVRVANSLLGTELVLIAADQIGESLDRAWFYVPRLLAENASVLVEKASAETGETMFQPMTRLEVEALALKARPRRLAA